MSGILDPRVPTFWNSGYNWVVFANTNWHSPCVGTQSFGSVSSRNQKLSTYGSIIFSQNLYTVGTFKKHFLVTLCQRYHSTIPSPSACALFTLQPQSPASHTLHIVKERKHREVIRKIGQNNCHIQARLRPRLGRLYYRFWPENQTKSVHI